jgi:predicted amidohydrolase YtcJ
MSELILVNGKLTTQDPAYPTASAAAIRDGRFVAVGSDDEIRSLALPETQVIDLEGRRVLPGLIDSHVHFYDWAIGQKHLKLENTISLAGVLEQVVQAVRTAAPQRWILGQGWNSVIWPEGRMPNRDDLDQIAPNNPVFLMHASLHQAVANTPALRFAGITAETPDPPQGIIDRDSAGNPTGILRDLAMNLITGTMPHMDESDAATAFKEGFALFHRLGLTGVHDLKARQHFGSGNGCMLRERLTSECG